MTGTLSYEELVAEIARYSYRPYWTLSVLSHPYDGPTLFVVAPVLDGYDSSKTIDLGVRSPIPPMHSTGQFGEWLLWRLLLIESHECREMLRYNGDLIADPHAEDTIKLRNR